MSWVSKRLVEKFIKLGNDDEYDEADDNFLVRVVGHHKSEAGNLDQKGNNGLCQPRQES